MADNAHDPRNTDDTPTVQEIAILEMIDDEYQSWNSYYEATGGMQAQGAMLALMILRQKIQGPDGQADHAIS